ncbi:FISUMP domain-containing protein [Methanohalobium sp.]|uniref:FISUMP domain-containing protein n=1 Tax=Methanohalobium sp. TaxID=2837493 RepID=UPI0025EFA407|nr:FISUMP domain-containing protein [Methanohalobium sp.]
MKRLLLLILVLVLTTGITSAQSPDMFNYQAVARDDQGNVIANQSIGIKISILQGSANGTVVYEEEHTQTTNEQGLISLMIGNGTTISGTFSDIDWSTGSFYLEVAMDETGGTSYSTMGTTQLVSVPYAKYADSTGSAFSGEYGDLSNTPDFTDWDQDVTDDFSGSYSDLMNTPDLSDTTNWNQAYDWGNHADSGYIKQEKQGLSDVIANNNSAGDNRIQNVADPNSDKDAANKAYVDKLLRRIRILERMSGIDTIQDSEGNVYRTVEIGNQTWMAENLKATTYSDGSEITGRYWYEFDINGDGQTNSEDSTIYVDTYGFLYDWSAAMNGASSSNSNPSGVQGACPDGWHIPSRDEWLELANTLGGTSVAGGKIKETGYEHWESPNTGATNETGFTALPNGVRFPTGFHYQLHTMSFFKSSTEASSSDAYYIRIEHDEERWSVLSNDKDRAHGIRCVKD